MQGRKVSLVQDGCGRWTRHPRFEKWIYLGSGGIHHDLAAKVGGDTGIPTEPPQPPAGRDIDAWSESHIRLWNGVRHNTECDLYISAFPLSLSEGEAMRRPFGREGAKVGESH
jgi:hypothetical protein